MDQRDLLGSARDQLDRVLGFFPRVDAKASVILAVDTGMLAFLVAHVPSPRLLTWWEVAIRRPPCARRRRARAAKSAERGHAP